MSTITLTDILRRLENLIRIGTVLAVSGNRCRVKTGGIETDWLKWITGRAGQDVDWWPPSVGEQVILFSLSGELSAAFVLTGIYSDDAPQPSQSMTARTVKFSDGTIIEYEAENSTLKVDGAKTIVISNAQTITVNAAESVMLNTPKVICSDLLITKNLQVTSGGTMSGNIQHKGGQLSSNGVVLDSHVHSDVEKGNYKTGGPS